MAIFGISFVIAKATGFAIAGLMDFISDRVICRATFTGDRVGAEKLGVRDASRAFECGCVVSG
jgi:hypothetical protein